MEQYSDEWWESRKGKVTASKVFDILPSVKTGKYLATRKDYMWEKVIERLGGTIEQGHVSKEMQRGTDLEPEARLIYEAETGLLVDEVGFIDHPTIKDLGASPDGMIEDAICLEVKCPKTSTHGKVVLQGKIEYKYKIQMNVQMMCTGASTCHYVDYDSRLPGYEFIMIGYPRDDKICNQIETEVKKFHAELDDLMEKLKGRNDE